MTNIEEELYKLTDYIGTNKEEIIRIEESEILKLISEMKQWLVKIINKTSKKKNLTYEESRIIENLQIDIIQQMKNIVDILEQKRVY